MAQTEMDYMNIGDKSYYEYTATLPSSSTYKIETKFKAKRFNISWMFSSNFFANVVYDEDISTTQFLITVALSTSGGYVRQWMNIGSQYVTTIDEMGITVQTGSGSSDLCAAVMGY